MKSEGRWASYKPREGTDEELHHYLRLDSTLLFPPLPPPDNHVLAEAIQRATVELGGQPPEVSGATGATDAAWYAQRGISAVIYGPGDGQTAHEPDEFIEIDDVHFTTKVLALAALQLVGK